MTAAQRLLLWVIPCAYVIGSIPFGLIVGLSRGVDPRRQGSGNIGATNVGRLLGGKFFAIVFTLDLLKGLLPMAVGAWLLGGEQPTEFSYLLWLLVGFAAIFGHMCSLFLKFKGGKGVATSTGVILGLYPYYTLPAIVSTVVFIVVFKLSRYVSLASIIGSLAFPLAYVAIGLCARPQWPLFATQLPLLVFAIVMALMIVWRHRTNITRLRAGTEHKFKKS